MGDTTSATPTPTKGSVTEKSPRPILKRKSTPGNSSLLGSARVALQQVIEEPKLDMAASFLQFCAMCEKQIMTPCNSILYCSEACRRKDSVKPLTAAILSAPSAQAPSTASPPVSEPPSPRPVLSPRLPTGMSFTSRSSATSIPSADLHDHKSDLDPTEWKPKLPERSHSEAFRYLSRFHRSLGGAGGESDGGSGGSIPASMSVDVEMAAPTPSLGNTPTTTASSSLSTNASFVSPPRHGHVHSHSYSYSYSYNHNCGYDFNTRPLPMRQNRWYSFNHSGTPNGIDLVTPHVVPPPLMTVSSVNGETVAHPAATTTAGPTPVDDEGLRWEKRKVMFAVPAAHGDDGLSGLFAERM